MIFNKGTVFFINLYNLSPLTKIFLPTRLKISMSAISSRALEILFKEVSPMDNSVVYFDFKCGMILPRTKEN